MKAAEKSSETEQQYLTNLYRTHTRKEPVVCAVFGCGVILSEQEELYGNKCVKHSYTKKPDIMQVIKWPDERTV